MRYLQVLLGGAVGSLLRYGVGLFVLSRYPGRFPLGTFAINLVGAFFIGVVVTGMDADWRPLLVTGLLGGFTTFSAFEFETYALGRDGLSGLAVAYAAGSVAAGFLACWAGARLGAGMRR